MSVFKSKKEKAAKSQETIFGTVIPILTDAEYDDKGSEVWKLREKDNSIARLQVMYHVATHMKDDSGMLVLGFETVMLGEKADISKHMDYKVAMKALDEIMAAAKASLARVEAEKTAAFKADPHLTADGKEPNAVLVPARGKAELIHLKGFVSGSKLGAPLDCDRVDMVLKGLPDWADEAFALNLAGYVDANGISKNLEENERIQSISGYDYIAGGCVLVGTDDDFNYKPLNPQDAVTICNYFNK